MAYFNYSYCILSIAMVALYVFACYIARIRWYQGTLHVVCCVAKKAGIPF